MQIPLSCVLNADEFWNDKSRPLKKIGRHWKENGQDQIRKNGQKWKIDKVEKRTRVKKWTKLNWTWTACKNGKIKKLKKKNGKNGKLNNIEILKVSKKWKK